MSLLIFTKTLKLLLQTIYMIFILLFAWWGGGTTSSYSSEMKMIIMNWGAATWCTRFDFSNVILFSLLLSRNSPTDGRDDEWDVDALVIRAPLSPAWRSFCLKTLERGGHCGSFLYLHYRSVSSIGKSEVHPVVSFGRFVCQDNKYVGNEERLRAI